ncbi:MAG: hypothetical protein ACI4ML_06625 [Aristaeellaceae bacterium]
MENIFWLVIMAPCSMVFTGIGIYAWQRKEPMWFWSGTTVKASDITDIPAYNHANGRMWMLFSLPLWLSAFLGLFSSITALVLLASDFIIGLPVLVMAYNRIYARYRA